MPYFRLETNMPRSIIPDGFFESTTKLLAKHLNKPENFCLVNVQPNQIMKFGGSNDPCGYATLVCKGRLGIEENKKIAAALYDHIEKQLGLPKDKWYIIFVDPLDYNIGYNGTTCHGMFGTK